MIEWLTQEVAISCLNTAQFISVIYTPGTEAVPFGIGTMIVEHTFRVR